MVAQMEDEARLTERLARSGFRFTPQREHVYQILLQRQDHPTAEEVFIGAKKGMPENSMATVYNCLDALVKCGLVKLVNLDRGATRYCANMREHWHFYCDECESVFDIDASAETTQGTLPLPKGFKAERYEVAIHGLCPACERQRKGSG